jgi:hypothetical protein
MKIKHILAPLFLFLYLIPAHSQDYYWSRGEKIFVQRDDSRNFYLFSDTDRTEQSLEIRSTNVFNSTLNWGIGNFRNVGSVEYISPAIINPMGDTLNFSNLFYVKLKHENDVEQLEKMAREHGIDILGNNKFMPLWYTLSCTRKSTGNALEMANLFYESKLFSITQADFLVHYKPNCVNDSFFNHQWNLRNTGH